MDQWRPLIIVPCTHLLTSLPPPLFPVCKVAEKKERERLEERRQFPLEDQLKKSLVGQELAIKTVAAGNTYTGPRVRVTSTTGVL